MGTSRKGSLSETTAEQLATHIVARTVERAGLDPQRLDDIILAESMYGGGDLARYAAVANGWTAIPGQAVNRHCAGSLTTVADAAAQVIAGMDRYIVAGGVQSFSTSPVNLWATPGQTDYKPGLRPTFPHTEDANDEVSLSVGWNLAQKYGLSRAEMDAWALRSHQRAVAAIDAGTFDDEIAPLEVTKEGNTFRFDTDEHPRRSSTAEKLASLNPLKPEIDGFSITAGNAAGVNDAAAALLVTTVEGAQAEGLEPLARVAGWAFVGVDPRYTGDGAIVAAQKLLDRTGLSADQIDVWEINEAFASVPVAACRVLGLDEEKVNLHGSGCSLGHPVAASGARMLTTLVHELRRRGGGRAVATMCAGAGQGGAVLIEA
ncbi:thiolase family protein [Enemella dayhoffiae]|uniref:thiolase family protein n=1 Tax=Enemella dayhoffiae TaxID=2016507 RepID=UPI001E2924F8|nr:thiolase family protein [Enemella dayhoffiae]